MGYERHHGMIITGVVGDDSPERAHSVAVDLGMSVSAITTSPVNNRRSFAVFTDGSKEGWAESDTGDGQRRALIAWLDMQRYDDGSSPLAWVEVQYGDDERETKVVAHSDEKKRTAA